LVGIHGIKRIPDQNDWKCGPFMAEEVRPTLKNTTKVAQKKGRNDYDEEL